MLALIVSLSRKRSGGVLERGEASCLSGDYAIWGAQTRTGAGAPRQAACIASAKNPNSSRPCWAQVARTLSIRSTKRQPSSLREPKLPFRHNTACRSARSAVLLVGSSPSRREKANKLSHCPNSLRLKCAIFGCGSPNPRTRQSRNAVRTGMSACCNPNRSTHPPLYSFQATNSSSTSPSIARAHPVSAP
jgi:hypothetical protein